MQPKDFNTIELARLHPETLQKLLSADLMRSALNRPAVQLYDYFKSAQTSATSTDINGELYNVGDLKMTVFDNMMGGGEFNFIANHPSDQSALMNVLIEAEQDADLKNRLTALRNICLYYCNSFHYPFANITQSQFNMAKQRYKSVSVDYAAGTELIINLAVPLSERVAVTVWKKEVGFADENMGRSVYVQNTIKYRVNMSGIKSGNYELRIPLLDAVVEII